MMPTESPPVVADSSPAKVRDKQSRRRSSGMFGNKRMKGSSLSSGNGHKAVSSDHHRVIVHAPALSPNPCTHVLDLVHVYSCHVSLIRDLTM